MHDKDDPTNCDDDSNHDDFRDIVCMTRIISTVYDEDSNLEALGEHLGTILGSLWVSFC